MEQKEGIVRFINALANCIGKRAPHLQLVLGMLELKIGEEGELFSTDGKSLMVNASALVEQCGSHMERIEQNLVHVLLHVLLLHPYNTDGKKREIYDLAADIAVVHMMQHLGYYVGSSWRNLFIRKVLQRNFMNADRLYEQLCSLEKMKGWQSIDTIGDGFFMDIQEGTTDTHEFWYKKENTAEDRKHMANEIRKALDGGIGKAEGQTETIHCPNKDILKMIGLLSGQFQEQKIFRQYGSIAGISGNAIGVSEEESMTDYFTLLREFLQMGERACRDECAIDYALYSYGFELYDSIALIEPPEMVEEPELVSMVIAIDTSGSCCGNKVKQFLSETFELLSESGVYEREMEIVLLLADSQIQQEFLIFSKEDIPEPEQLEFSGGGTDFRPVFKRVERLVKDGSLSENPRVLFYYSDGDGRFPEKEPGYPVVFCFEDEVDCEYAEIPDWIKKVVIA